MSEVPLEDADHPNQSKSGPNYLAYYKHLVVDLFSESGECTIPFLDLDSAETVKSSSYFADGVGKDLSQFKKERLKAILNESAVRLNAEVDEILDHILATSQIGSNLREKEKFPRYSNASPNEDVLHSRKRKAFSTSSTYSGNNSSSHRELGLMERGLEELLNVVMSKCRPMTTIEKHQLGKKIRKLPERALDRVAEILQSTSNSSARALPENIAVNLEEQDDVTLWRIHYYVELVVKANNL